MPRLDKDLDLFATIKSTVVGNNLSLSFSAFTRGEGNEVWGGQGESMGLKTEEQRAKNKQDSVSF